MGTWMVNISVRETRPSSRGLFGSGGPNEEATHAIAGLSGPTKLAVLDAAIDHLQLIRRRAAEQESLRAAEQEAGSDG